MTRYVPLWCKSNYSFLEGASHPEELVVAAAAYQLPAFALTDRDGVYGVARAHAQVKETGGCTLIIGAEISLHDSSTILLLASDREGYANLCQLITAGRLRNPKGECSVSWQEVCQRSSGLLAIWGGSRCLLLLPATATVSGLPEIARDLQDSFADRLYVGITRHHLSQDLSDERTLRRFAADRDLPLVAMTEVLYHTPARRPLQDVLTCVRNATTLRAAGTTLKANAEHALRTPRQFARLFADAPEAVARTLEIGERCGFSLSEIRYRYPSEQLPEGRTSAQWLRELTWTGAHRRYGSAIPPEATALLAKELELIEELDYCGYFLTMWEIVGYCREHHILCQGRGSAANSVVCYCLEVTAVDPVKLDLLFERFISRERAEPPDIDLDIEHQRREEVIQHVYQKYGRDHAAMVANVVRYRLRSAVREVGKTLGLPLTTLDRVAKLLGHHEGDPDSVIAGALQQAGVDPESHSSRLLAHLAAEIREFPRHLSIHPGGFLLGSDPVATLVPIENATMEQRTVIQWDKYDVEALGLFKVDLLGLGALTQLHHCFQLLRAHRGLAMEMAGIPHDDPATFQLAQAADTVGVFQIESRAQMAMLPRLKPRTFYDLVIEVSIVRPGPITGGMVHPYLRRRNGEEPVDYPHPSLEPVLSKTLGVPLFQEQVMRLAVVAADYTAGEADQLRRDMAAWRRSGRIEKHGEKIVARMTKKGIPREFAQRVFDQIRGFGEYGFPESHAASFALIAYSAMWMKCHYPVEFTCGLLNAWPMGFYSPATIVEDARRHGIEVRPIDVLHSDWECTLEPRPPGSYHSSTPGRGDGRFALRMGLRYVKGLSETVGRRVEEARRQARYASLRDLMRRTRADKGALARLAESGALERIGSASRRAGSWAGGGERRNGKTTREASGGIHDNRRMDLWQVTGIRLTPETPELELSDPERVPDLTSLRPFETIAWDYDASSHSARGHPLEPFRSQIEARGLPDAQEVRGMEDGARVAYAGLAICRQRPGTAKGVVFMTLEDETGFVNLVVWEKVFASHRPLILTTSFLGVTGTVQSRDGVVHVVARSFWRPNLHEQPAATRSRDFH